MGPLVILCVYVKYFLYIGVMKSCRKCKCKLVIGENIPQYRANRYDWLCIPCTRKGGKKGRPQIHDPNTLKQRIKEGRKKSRSKYPAGIYCFKEREEIVYIGESKQPFRRREQHLFSNSSILKEELQHCEWEIMEYIEDKRMRLIREFELICQYKPKYNHPYRI